MARFCGILGRCGSFKCPEFPAPKVLQRFFEIFFLCAPFGYLYSFYFQVNVIGNNAYIHPVNSGMWY
jgi:hypothetical protein